MAWGRGGTSVARTQRSPRAAVLGVRAEMSGEPQTLIAAPCGAQVPGYGERVSLVLGRRRSPIEAPL
jgi:hypothetical protein